MAIKELHELIAEARVELRKAAGHALSPEEQEKARRNAAIEKFEMFVLPTLGVGIVVETQLKSFWGPQGPTARLKAGDQIFHLRKGDGKTYILHLVKEQDETEVARIEASDPHFGSRVLVAIGDAVQVGVRP